MDERRLAFFRNTNGQSATTALPASAASTQVTYRDSGGLLMMVISFRYGHFQELHRRTVTSATGCSIRLATRISLAISSSFRSSSSLRCFAGSSCAVSRNSRLETLFFLLSLVVAVYLLCFIRSVYSAAPYGMMSQMELCLRLLTYSPS